MPWCGRGRACGGRERGSAVAGFALVSLAVLPLVMAIQLAVVWHIRNTLVDAASEGARYGAGYQRSASAAAARARAAADASLDDRLVDRVAGHETRVHGQPGIEVDLSADVPLLGLWGPTIRLHVRGHAVSEVLP
jgi:hypothetical protein